MFKTKSKSTVIVNGQTFTGRNVSIQGNKVIIDGQTFQDEDAKEINISIDGSIDKLDVDACNTIEVSGNVNELQTMSGDVEVKGDVRGGVSTMSGDVRCKNVKGMVSSMSGDIKCN